MRSINNLKRVGIYGVSSTGKTTIAKCVENYFKHFAYVDGSSMIDKVCNGGLARFKKLSDSEKNKYRKKAIDALFEYQEKTRKHLVISGHYSFLQKNGHIVDVWNSDDNRFYTDIIVINDIAENVHTRCIVRNKTCLSIDNIKKWIDHENRAINSLLEQNIYNVEEVSLKDKLIKVKEIINRLILEIDIKRIIDDSSNKLMVVIDADGTLIPYDSSTKMFKYLNNTNSENVKQIFKKYEDYCFKAFYDVSHYYSTQNTYLNLLQASEKTALEIDIRPEFIDLIKSINANFIILTAGFSILWELVLERHQLNDIHVIGGNTAYDRYLIGQNEKGYVIDLLKKHNKNVVCFGDALVDKQMLLKGNLSYLIVDERIKKIIPHIQDKEHIKYVSFQNIEIERMEKVTFKDIKIELETK